MAIFKRSSRSRGIQAAIFAVFIALNGCQSSQKDEKVAVERPSTTSTDITTTSFPIHYLVKRLAPPALTVECLLPVGEDAPHWHPPAKAIAQAAQSQWIIANGADYEPWIDMAMLAPEQVLKSAKALPLITLENAVHSHGDGPEHAHGSRDPHTFASPKMYQGQAEVVAEALKAAYPQEAQGIEGRWMALKGELEALSAQLKASTQSLQNASFLSNHPSFNYFGRQFSWRIQNLDLSPDMAPDGEALAKIQAWQKSVPEPHILLWEATPSAAVIAALPKSLKHLVLDPLEQPADGANYDYMKQMEANIQSLQRFTQGESTASGQAR